MDDKVALFRCACATKLCCHRYLPTRSAGSDSQGEDMKRKIIGFVVALAAVTGLGLAAPAPASADLGGQCDADVDVNCHYLYNGYWEQCDVWTNTTRCAVDVTP